MKDTWQLQEAKKRLSTIVDRALTDGPQTITRQGEPVVVILSLAEFRRRRPKKKKSFLEIFEPIRGLDLDLTRPKDPPREVHL